MVSGAASPTEWELSAWHDPSVPIDASYTDTFGFATIPSVVNGPGDMSTAPQPVAPGVSYFLGETAAADGEHRDTYSAQIDFTTFTYWNCVDQSNIPVPVSFPLPSVTVPAGSSVTCTVINADTPIAPFFFPAPDPDLPGALANIELLDSGSLVIPMGTLRQNITDTDPDDFNLTAYGLANRFMQNDIPLKWAISATKPKEVGTATFVGGSQFRDATKNFAALGVQVGDLITNVSDGNERYIVTQVGGPGNTQLNYTAVDGDNFDVGDEYVVDGQDFAAAATLVRGPATSITLPNTFHASAFIVSAEFPIQLGWARVILGLDAFDPVTDSHMADPMDANALNPDVPFEANASQQAVRVYQLDNDDTPIDVRYTLTHKTFAAVSDFNTTIHSNILTAAGIPGTDTCTAPGNVGYDPNTCNWNLVNPVQLSNIECSTIHLEPHRDADPTTPPGTTTADVVQAVQEFVAGGGNFMAQCHATEYFATQDNRIATDESVIGQFITTLGISQTGNAGDNLQFPNAPMAFNQITGNVDGGQGGSVPAWEIPDNGTYKHSGYVSGYFDGSPNVHKAAAGKFATGAGVGGNVFYLGGHQYGSGDLSALNGQRMMLNTLFVPPDRPFSCGLQTGASLTIVKVIENDNGGTGVVGDFNITTTVGAPLFPDNPGPTIGVNNPVISGTTTTHTSNGISFTPVVNPTTVTISEDDVAGYSEGDWSCVDDGTLAPVTVTPGTGNSGGASLDISIGQGVTCTITNDDLPPQGTIIVQKETLPDGSGQLFDFTPSWGAVFQLSDGQSNNSGLLNVGTYSVSETVPAGWALTSATCDDGSPINAIDLNSGETVTCTFTNTQNGQIEIEKQTLPDGSPQSFTFTGDVAGSLSDGQVATQAVAPGQYTSTETVPFGWALTDITCSDNNSTGNTGTGVATFNVEPGETVRCVFTNTQLGSISIEKQTLPDGSPEIFGFTGAINTSLIDGASASLGGILPGQYLVTETVPADWALTDITCNDGNSSGDLGTATATFNVEAGESVTCVFTNTEDGRIEIEKQTLPDGAPDLFDFTGAINTTLADGGVVGVGVTPGQYQVTETVPAGWALTDITCNDGDSSGDTGTGVATFNVAAGETVRCVFTNTQQSRIEIEKQTLPDGSGQSFTFTGDVGGSLTDGGTAGVDVAPGQYTSTETVPTGWALTDITCNDANSSGDIGTGVATFNVEPGETVRCVFTNTQDGQIEIEKQTLPDGSSQVFTFTGDVSGMLMDGDSATQAVAPGTYNSTETVPTGWALTSIVCDDNNSSGDIGTGIATFNVEPGETVRCVYTNTQDGQIEIEKQTLPDGSPQIFTFTGDVSGMLMDGDSATQAVAPGTYNSTETVPTGWVLTSIVCNDNNSSGDIGTGIATFNVEPGETVRCVYTNTQDGQIEIEKQTLPDGSPQVFTFTGDVSGMLMDGDSASQAVAPGTYNSTETVPTGWVLTSIVCNDGNSSGDIGTGIATFNVEPGETVRCVYTNTQDGRIEIEKQTLPDGSPQVFTFTGDVSGMLSDGQSAGADVAPGQYTSTETVPMGWILNSIVCDDANSTGDTGTATATFNVEPGETVRCVFTNAAPSIMIDKTGSLDLGGDGVAGVGDVINYTLTVTNNGDVTLTNVTVTDPLITDPPNSGTITCPPPGNGNGTLAAGESVVCTATYTLTAGDITTGNVPNTATVTGDCPGPLPNCATDDDPHDEPIPGIEIVKDGTLDLGGDGVAGVGDVINYTLTVTNTGMVTLTNVTITDPLITDPPNSGTITCPPPGNGNGTLAAGESVVCTATYTLTAGDITTGNVPNTATVTGDCPSAANCATDDDPHDEPIPGIEIVKDGTLDLGGDGVAGVGDVINYTLTVTNTGMVTLTNVTITDPLITDPPNSGTITCPPPGNGNGTLAAGESVVCTATYTLTAGDITTGNVPNTATVTGDCPSAANCATDDDPHDEPIPGIEIVKDGTLDLGGDGVAGVGDVINYTLTVTNTGMVTLTNVTITDPLITDPPNSGTITCPPPGNGNGTLAAGESVVCTATYTLTAGDITTGNVPNTATVTGDCPSAANCATDDDPHDEPIPGIEIVKDGTLDLGGDGVAGVGDVINYTLTVTNTGMVTLTNVTITDPLITDPPNSGTITCPPPGNGNGTLAAGESVVCTATYTLTAGDITTGNVPNTATVTGDCPSAANCATDDDPHDEPIPGIEIVKDGTLDLGGDGVAGVGDVINYTLTVTNTGMVTLTNVTITDPLITDPPNSGTITCPPPGNGNGTLAAGESVVCTATYTLTAGDITTGNVPNTATVTGDCPSAANCATDDDPHDEPIPSIDIVKDGTLDLGGNGIADVGDLINYTLTVTNTGMVTLTNVTITDPLITDPPNSGTITCPPPGNGNGTLAAGESVICTATYALTQDDINTGNVPNTATVTGDCPSAANCATDDDPHEEPVPQGPAIDIVKTADPQFYSRIGEMISYSFEVTNVGNLTLTSVTVSDPLIEGPPNNGTITCPAPGNGAITLDPTESVTCTGTYTIQAADMLVPSIPNTATAEGQCTSPAPACPVDDMDNESIDRVVIDLSKTIIGLPILNPGDGSYTVTYVILAQNLNQVGDGFYDLVDTFDLGMGITLNSATIDYVGGAGETQTGTLQPPGTLPLPFMSGDTIVTDEGLAAGLSEQWLVTANFAVDIGMIDPVTSECTPRPGTPVAGTGFYNAVEGSDTDPNTGNNQDCDGLPDPNIDLEKSVLPPAQLQGDGSYNVQFVITALNTGQGAGFYDLVDTFSPGDGITFNTAVIEYQFGVGEDDQSGTLLPPMTFPLPFMNGDTIVDDEALAAGQFEQWLITANFLVDPTMVDPATSGCPSRPGDPMPGTGFSTT